MQTQIECTPPPLQYPIAVEGLERVYKVAEVAQMLRWSSDSVRRYFKDLPGVLVKYQPRRYKRPYRSLMIPESVVQQQWNKMACFNSTLKATRGLLRV